MMHLGDKKKQKKKERIVLIIGQLNHGRKRLLTQFSRSELGA